MCVSSTADAQMLNLKTGSDALVEDAVKDAIVVIDSKYCILDTESNQKYGRNGQEYFNILKFIGCKTDNGIIVSETALNPWDKDKAFDKYRNNKKYEPLLDESLTIQSLSGGNESIINISNIVSLNNDSTLACIKTKETQADGLLLSDNPDAASNWMIWIEENSENENKESSMPTLSTIKKNIDLTNGEVAVDSPNPTRSYKGGFYISAKVVTVGIVEFSLAGMTIIKDCKWTVVPINDRTFTKSTDSPSLKETPEIIAPEEDLTPVKGNEKDRKKKKSKAKKK